MESVLNLMENKSKMMTSRGIVDEIRKRTCAITAHIKAAWEATLRHYEQEGDMLALLSALDDGIVGLYRPDEFLPNASDLIDGEDDQYMLKLQNHATKIGQAHPFFVGLLDRPFILMNIQCNIMLTNELRDRFEKEAKRLGLDDKFLYGMADFDLMKDEGDEEAMTKAFGMPFREVIDADHLTYYRLMTFPNMEKFKQDEHDKALELYRLKEAREGF